MRGAAFLVAALALIAEPVAAQDKAAPYWASLASGKARVRTGPGRNFPAVWLYQRRGLPLRVVATVPNWRRVVDADGQGGWMQANMLSDERSALVRGAARPLLVSREAGAKIAWRVAPGVVGRVRDCDGRWCVLAVGGRQGWIDQRALWGVDARETLP